MSEDTAETAATTGEVVRWYTLARKFPQLIGKTHDGRKLPGGPYTITQAAAGIGAGVVLWRSQALWAPDNFIMFLAIVVGACAGVVYGVGLLPLNARSPVSIVTGLGQLLLASPTGALAGTRVRIPAPPRRGRIGRRPIAPAIWNGPLPPPPRPVAGLGRHRGRRPDAAPAPAETHTPTPAAAPPQVSGNDGRPPETELATSRPALTGLQQLLAGTRNPADDRDPSRAESGTVLTKEHR